MERPMRAVGQNQTSLFSDLLFSTLGVLLLMPAVAFAQVSAVVNGASFAGAPGAGSVATIFGSNLANTTASASTVPLPYSLGGITVTVNGTTAPLWYVSPTQVNFEVPADAKAGQASIVVGSAPSFAFTIPQAAPGIFAYGSNRAIAVNRDNSLTDSNHPAAPGSAITVYLTGIGPLDNPVATDTQAPAQPLSRATLPASAIIGGQNAPISFLGLTPGGIALAQANLTVPSLASGDYPVAITIGGVTSNAPLISVGSAGGSGTTLTQLGSLALPDITSSGNIILNGNVAYSCGSQGIHVLDISSPSAPKLLSTFGQSDLNGSGVFCTMFGNNLLEIVNTQSLFVYGLANPTQPQSLSGRVAPPLSFAGSAFFSGNTGFFTTDWFQFFGSTISAQHGDLYAYDFSNPAQPAFLSSLQPVSGQPASSNLSPKFGGIAVDSGTAYIASTTSTGGDPNGGQAAVGVIDISNPQNMQALSQLLIPQATVVTTFLVQNNLAIVVGNTKSWRNPGTPNFDFTGVMTLTSLDIANHRSPVVLNTLVTSYPTNFDGGSILVPLGTGKFLVSIFAGADNNVGPPLGSGELAILDATDPRNLKLTSIATISQVYQIALNSNTLYVLTGAGLSIYRIG
jgi:uncharacterized protein (TIGR03437 family)